MARLRLDGKPTPAAAAAPAAFGPPTPAEREEFLASDRFVSTEQMAARLGIERGAVQAAIDAHRMLAFLDESGRSRLPAFYADMRYKRAQLEQVTHALGPAMFASCKYHFFTTRRGVLAGKCPLEAIVTGGFEEVLDLARRTAAEDEPPPERP